MLLPNIKGELNVPFSSLHKKEEDNIAKVPRKSSEEKDSTKAAVRTTMAEAIIKQSCLFS